MTTAEIMSIACAASGPITGAIYYLSSLSNDKKARKIVKDWATESLPPLIDSAFAKFKDQLNSDKGYRRSESCKLIMEPMKESLVGIEHRVHRLENSHSRRLDIAAEEG